MSNPIDPPVEIDLAPWPLVKKCRHEGDAIRLCIRLSDFSEDTVAHHFKIDRSYFSRMMNGRANWPQELRVALMEFCGNYAPAQYEWWKLDLQLIPKSRPGSEEISPKAQLRLLAKLEAAGLL